MVFKTFHFQYLKYMAQENEVKSMQVEHSIIYLLWKTIRFDILRSQQSAYNTKISLVKYDLRETENYFFSNNPLTWLNPVVWWHFFSFFLEHRWAACINICIKNISWWCSFHNNKILGSLSFPVLLTLWDWCGWGHYWLQVACFVYELKFIYLLC